LARLQRTASFYGLPFGPSRSGHSLSAAPDVYDAGDIQVSSSLNDILAQCANQFSLLEIDEVSPSEDDRIAEEALRPSEGISQAPTTHFRFSPSDSRALPVHCTLYSIYPSTYLIIIASPTDDEEDPRASPLPGTLHYIRRTVLTIVIVDNLNGADGTSSQYKES